MKIGTARHPKTIDFQLRLGISLREACGILELLWQWTAEYAPQGDVGRWTDNQILTAIDCQNKPEVMEALIGSRWLDIVRRDCADMSAERPPCPVDGQFMGGGTERQLFIHDWQDHCPDYIRKRLKRQGLHIMAAKRRPMAGQRLPTRGGQAMASHGKASPVVTAAVEQPSATQADSPPVPVDLEQIALQVFGVTPAATLGEWLSLYDLDVVKAAIAETERQPAEKHKPNYTAAILQRWAKDGKPNMKALKNVKQRERNNKLICPGCGRKSNWFPGHSPRCQCGKDYTEDKS